VSLVFVCLECSGWTAHSSTTQQSDLPLNCTPTHTQPSTIYTQPTQPTQPQPQPTTTPAITPAPTTPRFQSLDPDDPWLQWEWGKTLLALDRTHQRSQEAALHFEVAAAIFSRHHAQVAGGSAHGESRGGGGEGQQTEQGSMGGADSSRSGSSGTLSAVGGRLEDMRGGRLGAEAALTAATDALQSFIDALAGSVGGDSSGGGGGTEESHQRRQQQQQLVAVGEEKLSRLRCEALLRMCHLHLQRVAYVQQRGGGAGKSTVLSVKAGARRCVQRMQEDRACDNQVRELAKLIGQQSEG